MPKISGYANFDEHRYTSIRFQKTGGMIREQATLLLKEVDGLIEEREGRIRSLSKELGVADAAELLLRVQRGGREPKISAALREEMDDLQRKRQDQARLRAIVKNIEPERVFDLSFAELEYYEF
jgi:hypothetical protein